MSKAFKIAFLRMRVDTSATQPPDSAFERFFLSASDGSAILDYWSATTMGHLDFSGSKLFPWVDLSMTAAQLVNRGTCFDRAVAAAKAAGQDLGGYDRIVCVYHPGTGVNTGAYGDDAVLTTAVGHTYACHEIGHVVAGGDHSYGLPNLGDDWDGAPWVLEDVYGDPYDIMSAATFGMRDTRGGVTARSSSPVFSRTDLATVNPGWPTTSSWDSMGPMPARAFVHMSWPDALAGQVVTATRPANGQWAGRFTLVSAGLLAKERPSIVVLDDTKSSPARRWTIELRGCHGWDQGLETSGADLARRAVVVHEIVTLAGGKKQAWYRGRILVPLEGDTDVAVPNADLVVTVVEAAADGATAAVEIGTMARRTVLIEADVTHAETVLSQESREADLGRCGRKLLPWTVSDSAVTATLRARTTGFGGAGDPDVTAPPIRWRVGGMGVTTAGKGTIDVLGHGDGPALISVTLDYELKDASSTLILKSHVEAKPFTVEVTAQAMEGDGTNATSSAPFLLEHAGHQEGFGQELMVAIARCARSLVPIIPRPRPPLDGVPPWLQPERIRFPKPPEPPPPLEAVLQKVHPLLLAHLSHSKQEGILFEAEKRVRPTARITPLSAIEEEIATRDE